ncbi:hypothetical protein LINPERPRIM_LOCUS11220, partial [Linum perenne]
LKKNKKIVVSLFSLLRLPHLRFFTALNPNSPIVGCCPSHPPLQLLNGASIKSKTILTLQDEYENILQQLRHHALGEDESTESISSPVSSSSDLATDLEIQIQKRISEILYSNDYLDICIDIFEVMQF